MNKIAAICLCCCTYSLAFTQAAGNQQPIALSAYLELFYAYSPANPPDHQLPGFIYSHNRHNEVNLNLGLAKVAYTHTRLRANLALMAGTYANANLAAEAGVLKNIHEANAGVRLSKNKPLWIDAGIFASHIGFESAIGKDCPNLTRSLMAENSPYYESGVKISYTTPNNQWLLSALLLNGWQRIQRVQGNNTPAFGHQLTFKPNEKVTLNSSSFVGSDTPDSVRLMRYFHNFYLQLQCTKKLGLTLGFDAGAQQQTKGSQTFNSWYTYALIGKYAVFDKLAIAGRIEYYHDPRQVIVATGTQNGFQNYGFSLNTDYAIAENALWRIEGKQFYSKDPMFINNNKLVNNYFYITTSLALAF